MSTSVKQLDNEHINHTTLINHSKKNRLKFWDRLRILLGARIQTVNILDTNITDNVKVISTTYVWELGWEKHLPWNISISKPSNPILTNDELSEHGGHPEEIDGPFKASHLWGYDSSPDGPINDTDQSIEKAIDFNGWEWQSIKRKDWEDGDDKAVHDEYFPIERRDGGYWYCLEDSYVPITHESDIPKFIKSFGDRFNGEGY